MFHGANAINLDSKGRITIPTMYRESLMDDCAGQLVCTIDISSNCLLLYPLSEWQEIQLKLTKMSSTNPHERRLLRLILGNAHQDKMDKSGRFLIRPSLRTHGALQKQLMLVGQLNKFEVWNESDWNQQLANDIEIEKAGNFEMTERLQDFSL